MTLVHTKSGLIGPSMMGAFLKPDAPRSVEQLTEMVRKTTEQVAATSALIDKLGVEPSAETIDKIINAGSQRQAQLPSGGTGPVEFVPGDPDVLGVVTPDGRVATVMVPKPYYVQDEDATARLRSEAAELRQVVDDRHSTFVDRTRADTRLKEVERLLDGTR